MQLVDFILHVDRYLGAFVAQYGAWVYALLFLIVFVETGVVVMPFLPGDSLLFVVGALAGAGFISYPLACAVLLAAAILGDQCNYSIGRYFGPKVFQWEDSRFFNRRAFDKAHAFYERYGGVTVILARFMPFIRTFVPFVAGVAEMTRSKFTFFNVSGALIWVLGLVTAGYVFGNLPWVQANLSKIIWALILVPGLIAIYGGWKAGRAERAGFAVLKAPDIPSVLVETAFISNPDEERRLNSDKYQTDLADALLRGIVKYFSANPPLAPVFIQRALRRRGCQTGLTRSVVHQRSAAFV